MAWNIKKDLYKQMVDACVDGFPLEACGLFLGPIADNNVPKGEIRFVWPANNTEKSARIYSVDPKDMFEAMQFAERNGCEIVGVYHSHTHSESYPSPTDVKQAVDPNWCYAIVSLAKENIVTNYFQIDDSQILELAVSIV